MNPFSYARPADTEEALRRSSANGGARYIAGGTDLLQLLQEELVAPDELLDLAELPLRGITSAADGYRIGALTTLAEVAGDETVRSRLPAVAQALEETASAQVRNLATAGGNLLQRTRCLYFRDASAPCNKREPGSGCPAQEGQNRLNAILGGSEHCIAVHPSDFAVALVALEAEVLLAAPGRERSLRVEDLYLEPGETPHLENRLEGGEIITAIRIPASAAELRSGYLKVRDRASFEWALASAAVAVALEGEGEGARVREARIAVGGVATRPWRLRRLEEALQGQPFDAATIARVSAAAAEGASPRAGNAYKLPMLRATVERALLDLRSPA